MDFNRWPEIQPPNQQPSDPHFYSPAAPQLPHTLQQQQQQQQQQQPPLQSYGLSSSSSTYVYYSHHPSIPNPIPSSSSIQKHDLGVETYDPNPYAPHAGYEGQALLHGYPAAASSHYHGLGGDTQGFSVKQAIQHYREDPIAPYGGDPTACGARRKIMARPTLENLEKKKQKVIEGGATADSVRVCTICNIVCNSEKVFASHLAGEKHVTQARARPLNVLDPVASVHMNPQTNGVTRPSYNVNMEKRAKKPAKVVQSAYCEVCKVDCNSQEVLNSHKQGKKHKKMLDKLMESIAGKPTTTLTTPVDKKEAPEEVDKGKTANKQTKRKKDPATEEDLEIKKRRVVEGGALEDAVKVCTLCNVVCNSQTVFDYHIAGHKHAAMVQKQANTAVS